MHQKITEAAKKDADSGYKWARNHLAGVSIATAYQRGVEAGFRHGAQAMLDLILEELRIDFCEEFSDPQAAVHLFGKSPSELATWLESRLK